MPMRMIIDPDEEGSKPHYNLHSSHRHNSSSRLRRGSDRRSLRNYPLSTILGPTTSIRPTQEEDFSFSDSDMERGPLILDTPLEIENYYIFSSLLDSLRPRRHLSPVRRSRMDPIPVQYHSPKTSPSRASRHGRPLVIPVENEDKGLSKSYSESLSNENTIEDCLWSECEIRLSRKSLFQSKAEVQESENDPLSVPCEETSSSKNLQTIQTLKQGSGGISRSKDMLIGGANKLQPAPPDDAVLVLDDMNSSTLGSQHYNPNKDLTHCQGSSTIDDDDDEVEVMGAPGYPIYTALKKKLAKECRQIDYIRGDGNCFFRTISKQLYNSERYHLTIRNLIVDLIATNKDKFAQFVDGEDVQDHVERMCQEQSWATTCEIYAAATLLQRDIFMLTPDHLNLTYSWLLFKPVFQCDTQDTGIASHPCYLTMCNTNGNHYDRIIPEHGGCNCFLPHPELEGISYTVDLTES